MAPHARTTVTHARGALAAATLVGVALVGVALGPAAPPAAAQMADPLAGALGVTYETYRFGDAETIGIESLSLFTMPLGVRAPVFGRASLEASGAYARGELVAPGGESVAISGLTDTELRLRVPLVDETVVAQAIAILPTGKATLGLAEATVAGAFAADLLPFQVSNWGSGGGGGIGLTMVRPFGEFGVGLGATYIMSRAFEPLEGNRFAYRPGNTLLVSLAADRTIGATGKLTIRLGMQHHAADAVEDANLFRAGRRYQLMGTYAFAVGARSSGIAYGGVLHRQRGTVLRDFGALAVEPPAEVPAQNLYVAGGGMRMVVGRGVLQPRADLRIFRSDDGVGEGYVAELGAALEWPVGGAVLVPTLRGQFGSVTVRDDLESGLTGAELGLGIRLGRATR